MIIFLTSAGVLITQKVMGIYFPGQSVGMYNFLSFFIAAFILCFFLKQKTLKSYNKKTILFCALGSAVSISVISFVMTSLASKVPSVVLFPLFNGPGIILVCVGAAIVFKEKLNTPKLIGFVLGVLGLYIINL